MSQTQLELAATKRRTRADQLLAAFEKFHQANPRVWTSFKRFALEAVMSGRPYYSANAIYERIRWYEEIETKSGDVKLNNNHKAYYARLFHIALPQYAGFFRNRKLISEEKAAYENDIQVFNSGPPGEEADLIARLTKLLQKN